MDMGHESNSHRFDVFKQVVKSEFPQLNDKIRFGEISTILILQIKGSDVHPKVRHPDFFYQRDHPLVIAGKKSVGQPINKKTQLDITAPLDLAPEHSPVTSLVSPGHSMAVYHPVEIFHPINKNWIEKRMKIQPKVTIANGPAPDQARLLIGGADKDSWSSELWANVGHFEEDKWGHIVFVRSGKDTPLCFGLPRNLNFENLLLDGGKRRGESNRFRHLSGSPVRKSMVIVGPKPVHKSLALEYIYIVTQSEQTGWVKIGKTTQDPKTRLNGYNKGPINFDMNYIFATSNCDAAEKEIISRLNLIGFEKRGNEWYKMGSVNPAVSVIREVIKLHPPPVAIALKPIFNSKSSWVKA